MGTPTKSAPHLVLRGYWRSSASYRLRIGLAVKQLAYELVPVNIVAGEQKTEAYAALAPNQYVPCLLIDGEPFVESLPILELLDELAPEVPLLPRSPADRARVRSLAEMVNAGIQPLQNLHVLQHLTRVHEERDAWVRRYNQIGLAKIEAALAANEARGVTGDFAYGPAPTLADCTFLPQWYAARRVGVDFAPYPRFVRAVEAIAAYPGVDAAAPERQPDAVVPPP